MLIGTVRWTCLAAVLMMTARAMGQAEPIVGYPTGVPEWTPDAPWSIPEDRNTFMWVLPAELGTGWQETVIEVDGIVDGGDVGIPLQLRSSSGEWPPVSIEGNRATFHLLPNLLMRRDHDDRGTFYLDVDQPGLTITRLESSPLQDPPVVIEDVEMPSARMSDHLDRPWSQRAWVIRPGTVRPDTPVIYNISGFLNDDEKGWRHLSGMARRQAAKMVANRIDAIIVLPNVCVDLGHHGFIDSQTNGPVGTMFVEDFVPWIDDHYGLDAEAAGHYLTGHSSGGWSTTWLVLNWPDAFDAALATSPDPVDFHDFHGMDLYEDENAFITNDGMVPAFANYVRQRYRKGDRIITLDEVEEQEGGDVWIKHQIRAYEAAFSPLNANGTTRPLFDRETGVIDREVAEYWTTHSDITRLLSDGQHGDLSRLRFGCGTRDEYGLHRPLRLLEDRMHQEGLVEDDTFTWYPGTGHGLPSDFVLDFYRSTAGAAP